MLYYLDVTLFHIYLCKNIFTALFLMVTMVTGKAYFFTSDLFIFICMCVSLAIISLNSFALYVLLFCYIWVWFELELIILQFVFNWRILHKESTGDFDKNAFMQTSLQSFKYVNISSCCFNLFAYKLRHVRFENCTRIYIFKCNIDTFRIFSWYIGYTSFIIIIIIMEIVIHKFPQLYINLDVLALLLLANIKMINNINSVIAK